MRGRPLGTLPLPKSTKELLVGLHSGYGQEKPERNARDEEAPALSEQEALADQMYGKPFADLSGLDASGLIDVLKDIKAGKLSFADVQNSTAA